MAATIKDVARLAGTSTATVSKVMNGSYSISQGTVDRVHSAMEELHYHPNVRARNFARQSTRQVLFLTTLGEGAGFSNPHMFEIMSGLEGALGKKGYFLSVKNISPEDAVEFVKEVFASKMADGVVIHASVISRELDELIKYKEIPHLVLGQPSFASHFCGWTLIINWQGRWRQTIYCNAVISPLLLSAARMKIKYRLTDWREYCRCSRNMM